MDVNLKDLEKNIKGIANFAENLIKTQREKLTDEEKERLDSHLKEINFDKKLKNVDKALAKVKKQMNGR